jgi:urease accessory protein
MHTDHLAWLRLLQLSDSALPIGATAHSFGLETLVEERALTVDRLRLFLHDYVVEAGALEASYCRVAYAIGADSVDPALPDWLELNRRLDALKTARESREASTALGRRLLQLALDLDERPLLLSSLQSARQDGTGVHHCTAFGLVGGLFHMGADYTPLAYLHQTLAGLIAACQRLMPLGQSAASRILWELKPALIEAASQSQGVLRLDMPSFTPGMDVASMRHPVLPTRLFIS